jgi:hypothetical protein
MLAPHAWEVQAAPAAEGPTKSRRRVSLSRRREPRTASKGICLHTFYGWLGQQVARRDDVGAFARYAVADKAFPRGARRLHVVLLRYEGLPDRRDGAKLAHREWRQQRKAAA